MILQGFGKDSGLPNVHKLEDVQYGLKSCVQVVLRCAPMGGLQLCRMRRMKQCYGDYFDFPAQLCEAL